MKFYVLSFHLQFYDDSPAYLLGLQSTIIYSFASGLSLEEVTSMHRDTQLLKLDSHCVKNISFLGCTEIKCSKTLSLLHQHVPFQEVSNER